MDRTILTPACRWTLYPMLLFMISSLEFACLLTSKEMVETNDLLIFDEVSLGWAKVCSVGVQHGCHVNVKAMEEKDNIPYLGVAKEWSGSPSSNLEVAVTSPISCFAVEGAIVLC